MIGFNKHLSKKYKSHINAEICSSVSAVKYLYKYIFKGQDRTTAKLQNVDEIQQFIDAVYYRPLVQFKKNVFVGH